MLSVDDQIEKLRATIDRAKGEAKKIASGPGSDGDGFDGDESSPTREPTMDGKRGRKCPECVRTARKMARKNSNENAEYVFDEAEAAKARQNRRVNSPGLSSKGQAVRKLVRLARQEGFGYEDLKYVYRRACAKLRLKPVTKGRRLPNVLSEADFRKFFEVVDAAESVTHAILFRLMFYTAARVSELCNLNVDDVDLDAKKIRINAGKGNKDRYSLFADTFAVALRTYIGDRRSGPLFVTRLGGKFTSRRVQQLVKAYAEKAGVVCTPHSFRHAMLTLLTRNSGLADAEIQLLSGHSRRDSLQVYQHVVFDDAFEEKYNSAMKSVRI